MTRPRLERTLFAAALALGALTLWNTAFIESHWDEDDCVAIGWLLSKGWRLYRDVFSHHMPLDYLPSWALARLFGPSPEICRGFMVLLWALGCGALFSARRSKTEAYAAALFTLLSSQWLTFWYGQLMLVENLWAWAVVGLLALAERGELKPRESALAGVLLGVLAFASLTSWPACALLGLFFLRRPRRELAAGFAGFVTLFAVWSRRHADLGLWYQDAVRFNASSYAAFNGLAPGAPAAGFFGGALLNVLAYFAATFSWNSLEQFFEGLLRLAALGWILEPLVKRRPLEALWRAALVFSLKLRPEHFRLAPPHHSAPFFLAAGWLLSSQLVRAREALGALDRRWARAWTAACALLLLATLAPTSLATYSLRGLQARDRPRLAALSSLVAQATEPQDAVAAFPSLSRLYVESARAPATPNVFYLPWQAAWPEQHERTLAALKDRPPKLVAILETAIWGVPWKAFGADIDAWVRGNYRPVSIREVPADDLGPALWVRRDYAAELLRRCPSCAFRPEG